jgi:endoglucanase
VPDLLTEALFEIDCFRRLQLPDGGIPYGIESDGDPAPGEVSWLSTQRVYVSAPNIRDSWFYAAVAARAAKLLAPYRPDLAPAYLESAARAFAWAEKDYAARRADGRLAQYQGNLWWGTDARNLAALALYDATADRAYHTAFLEDSALLEESPETNWWEKHIQLDAAFLYARLLDDAKADPEIRKHAIVAVIKQADRAIQYADGNTFNLTTPDRHRPMFGGFFSTSGGTEIARAHCLTGKPEYLAALVRSCQFQSGCNPNNIVYTSGLGANPVRHPLHLDSRSSGQAVPVGLTTFGNVDYWNHKGGFWDWPITSKLKDPLACWPNPYDWPLTEAYFDIFLFVSMNEFVVDAWAPNVLVWGYLASRQ